ncbi:hypothetical protein PQX77_009467 [Marasmius sp. AFHP31]|nr:hypothetical protein PQX77_009467 [Marasmius sp. AFHP31]
MVPLAGTDQQLAQHLEEVLGDKEKLQGFLEQTGEDAQTWLDKLQQLIDDPKLDVTSRLRSLMITWMIRLSKRSGLHPKSLFIQNVRKLGKHPVAAGGFGDVWKGVINQSESGEHLVCLKVSKVYEKSDLDALFKRYLREALVWRHLKHQNVLPFLGIFYSKDDGQFCLISPWMDNGNLLQYLKTTRRAVIDHLVLAYDVATGLAYLHGEEVVHGDLKGLNILITPEGRACIADFGLSRIADTLVPKLSTSSTRATGTARWLAREILSDNSGPTKESDVYAFACVCYEIYTTLLPFHELPNDAAVMLRVLSGECPMRPTGNLELDDRMWNIMEACWNPNPASRPKVTEVLERIKLETLIKQRATWVFHRAEPKPWTGSHSSTPGSHDFTQLGDERPAKRKTDTEDIDFHKQIHSLSPLFVNTSAHLVECDLQDGNKSPLSQDSGVRDHYRAVGQDLHQRSGTFKDMLVQSTSLEAESGPLFAAKIKPDNGDHWEGNWWQHFGPNQREQRRRASTASEKVTEKEKYGNEGGWVPRCTIDGHDKGKGKDRVQGQRERSQSWQPMHVEEQTEFVTLIGFLIGTASEDRSLVLDACERASASEANAKEAIWALHREFKYGRPQAQLNAARLWAILLRNSTDTFINQSTSPRFLETLEELLSSSRTNPVVKKRVLGVLAAAAYASESKQDIGFRGLWKKVKPDDKPDEGIPFDTDDAMYRSVLTGDRRSDLKSQPYKELDLQSRDLIGRQHAHPNRNQRRNRRVLSKNLSLKPDDDATEGVEAGSGEHDRNSRDPYRELRERNKVKKQSKEQSKHADTDRGNNARSSPKVQDRALSRKLKKPYPGSSRDQEQNATQKIISPEEDTRRSSRESDIGKGKAPLLSQTLVYTIPEDFFFNNTKAQSNGESCAEFTASPKRTETLESGMYVVGRGSDGIKRQLDNNQDELYCRSPSGYAPIGSRSSSPGLHSGGARTSSLPPPRPSTSIPPRITFPGGHTDTWPSSIIPSDSLTFGQHPPHNYFVPPPAPYGPMSSGAREVNSLASASAGSVGWTANHGYTVNGTWARTTPLHYTSSDYEKEGNAEERTVEKTFIGGSSFPPPPRRAPRVVPRGHGNPVEKRSLDIRAIAAT